MTRSHAPVLKYYRAHVCDDVLPPLPPRPPDTLNYSGGESEDSDEERLGLPPPPPPNSQLLGMSLFPTVHNILILWDIVLPSILILCEIVLPYSNFVG